MTRIIPLVAVHQYAYIPATWCTALGDADVNAIDIPSEHVLVMNLIKVCAPIHQFEIYIVTL